MSVFTICTGLVLILVPLVAMLVNKKIESKEEPFVYSKLQLVLAVITEFSKFLGAALFIYGLGCMFFEFCYTHSIFFVVTFVTWSIFCAIFITALSLYYEIVSLDSISIEPSKAAATSVLFMIAVIASIISFRQYDCMVVEVFTDKIDKPVIYLYPEEDTDVNVSLTFDGILQSTYPRYNDGWSVKARPDGTLVDKNNKEYPYLFWEGTSDTDWDFSEGFCVKGEDTISFLEWALKEQGLNNKEACDFITYWLPEMEENKYNVVSFQKDTYTNIAKLSIDHAVDTEIRVFMAWYGSDTPVDIKEQQFNLPQRTGFTLVEWGGTKTSKK